MAEMQKDKWQGGRVSIHTFNVRTLRRKNKSFKLFTYLKNNVKQFLQKTYSVPVDLQCWNEQWKEQIIMRN